MDQNVSKPNILFSSKYSSVVLYPKLSGEEYRYLGQYDDVLER